MKGWLDQQAWFHAALRWLGIRRLANAMLARWPQKKSGQHGTVWRVRNLEGLFLYHEIVEAEAYGQPLADVSNLQTVLDVGCNEGYFLGYLKHRGWGDLQGLAVDANGAVLPAVQRLLEENQLNGIEAVQGLVGQATEEAEASFYVYPSHLGSSRFAVEEPGRVSKGAWQEVRVSVLALGQLWAERFGDVPIDLLKIDIEGSELDLLETEPELIRRARLVLMEVHTWLVDPAEVERQMQGLGFAGQCHHQEANTQIWSFRPS